MRFGSWDKLYSRMFQNATGARLQRLRRRGCYRKRIPTFFVDGFFQLLPFNFRLQFREQEWTRIVWAASSPEMGLPSLAVSGLVCQVNNRPI
jgi:hypothetical protein